MSSEPALLPDGYEIAADRERIDIAFVHRYLSEDSYWAKGRSRELVERSIANSLCFGIFDPNGQQAGFGRVVTDYATFGYVADVFVAKPHAGKGLGKALVSTMLAHPDVQGLRRLMLLTADAHALYGRFGFTPSEKPEMVLERVTPR